MPITPADIDSFIELLRQDPALRQRVFLAIASEQFLALPAKVDHLASEQADSRTASEERLARIEAILERVAERQARTELEIAAFREATERRFERVEQELSAFREATERRFEAVERRLEAVEQELAALRDALDLFRRAVQERFVGVENKLAALLGWQLQEQYAKHIYAYFGHILRKLRVLTPADVEHLVRPTLTTEEVKDLFLADVIARGRLADQRVYLIMEVSSKVDEGDVARARRRADLMRKAGLPCLAVVGGQEITESARLESAHSWVLCALDDGLQEDWQEVLTRSLQAEGA